MRGHVVKKRNRYFPVVELGRQPAQRCAGCRRRAGWISDGRLDACPRCGGELTELAERRQRWLAGHVRRRDAQSTLNAILADADRSGAYIEPSRKPLGAYLTEDWLPAVKATVRPSTFRSYKSAVEVHLVPALGAIELRHLSPSHINKMFADLLDHGRKDGTGLSPTSVAYYGVVLGRALRDAVRWQKIPRNVCELADPPKTSTPEMQTWDATQIRHFLKSTADHRFGTAYLLALTTGMRRAELLGARWSDLDLESGRLRIVQTLIVVDYVPVFSEPKTKKSRRSIKLDPGTLAALKRHRKAQLAERLAWGEGYEEHDLIFARENGSVLHPQSLSHAFESAAKAVGLPVIRLHDCRHSFATLALSAGVHPKIVSERLGHSSVAITMDRYSHSVPALEEEAANTIAALIVDAP